MLRDKMLAVITELNTQIAEREELIEGIALALLSGSNLFVVGDPGQAKSYAINEFRKRIIGARQFEYLLSKQTDEEALFGRLDLASLIPGAVPACVLEKDAAYQQLTAALEQCVQAAQAAPEDASLAAQVTALTQRMEAYQKSLAILHGGKPTIITANKLPEAQIIYLDELFKAGDGLLNSLLTALNEKRYTNEGVSIEIPALSFFAASNEIPNFKNAEESILAPLYDRFQLKIVTRNVQDRAARLHILRQKQHSAGTVPAATITLDELHAMQAQSMLVAIPEQINELMDDVLCELRRQGVTVSDRKFFGYGRIAQAVSWLHGHDTVQAEDLAQLKNYLWNLPEEIETVADVLQKLCTDPLRTRLDELLARAVESYAAFEAAPEEQRAKALIQLRTENAKLYLEWQALRQSAPSANQQQLAADALNRMEEMNRKAHEKCSFTCTPLAQLAVLQSAA